MQKKQYFLLALFVLFVVNAVGCADSQNVVTPSNKTGLSANERKEKRG